MNEKEVELNLIKNPVGLNQVLDILVEETEPYTLITVLNDKPADGQDISWIELGDFEKLVDISKSISSLEIKDVKIMNPNNPEELRGAKLITYSK